MLHLFNKVYIEFDDKIDINYDRIVISEQYGNAMLQSIDQIAYGVLMSYGRTYDEVVKESFVGFISSLKDHGNRTGKKIVIYCDNAAYKRLAAQWFAVTLPNLQIDGLKTIIDHTVYNQRITANTQLSSVYSMNLNSLWDGVGSIDESWEYATELTDNERDAFKNLGINLSYEFLLASYLSGDMSHYDEFKKTLHMFLRRWFKEMFTDNRQMVLLNLTNHKFLSTFGIDRELVDINSIDPLAFIEQLQAYADDEIWERDQNRYGICKIEGLPKEKLDLLKSTILKIYNEFEGMAIDRSVFGALNWIHYAAADEMTDEQIEEVVTYFVNNPFDTIGVPRFDFQNVNFPLMQHFLSQKFNGEDLSQYRLL